MLTRKSASLVFKSIAMPAEVWHQRRENSLKYRRRYLQKKAFCPTLDILWSERKGHSFHLRSCKFMVDVDLGAAAGRGWAADAGSGSVRRAAGGGPGRRKRASLKKGVITLLKGTVLRDRFQKCGRKLTDLGLNKGRGWFLNFSEAPLIFG